MREGKTRWTPFLRHSIRDPDLWRDSTCPQPPQEGRETEIGRVGSCVLWVLVLRHRVCVGQKPAPGI